MVNLRVLGARAEGPGRRATRVAFTGNIAQRVVDPGVQADTSAADAFLQLAESLSPLSRTMQGYADIKYKKLRQRSATEAQTTMRELEDDQRDLAARGKWSEIVKTNPELATLNPMARIHLQRLAGQQIFREYKQAIQEADAMWTNIAEESFGKPEFAANARREALEAADRAAMEVTEGLAPYALAMFEAENARWRPAWEQALGKAIGSAESKAFTEGTAAAMAEEDADVQALADSVHATNGTSGRTEVEMGHQIAIGRRATDARSLYTALLSKGDEATPEEWEAVVTAMEAERESMLDAHAKFESVAINGVTYASEERSVMDDALDANLQQIDKDIALARGKGDKVGSTKQSRANAIAAQHAKDGMKEEDLPAALDAYAEQLGISPEEALPGFLAEANAVNAALFAYRNAGLAQERVDTERENRARTEEAREAEQELHKLERLYYAGDATEEDLYTFARNNLHYGVDDVEKIIADNRMVVLKERGVSTQYEAFDRAYARLVAQAKNYYEGQRNDELLGEQGLRDVEAFHDQLVENLSNAKTILDGKIRNISPTDNPAEWIEIANRTLRDLRVDLEGERERSRDVWVGPLLANFERSRSLRNQPSGRNPFGGAPRSRSQEVRNSIVFVGENNKLVEDEQALETWGSIYDEIASRSMYEWKVENPSAGYADADRYASENLMYWQEQADARFLADHARGKVANTDNEAARQAARVDIRENWTAYSKPVEGQRQFIADDPSPFVKNIIFRLSEGVEPSAENATAGDFARLKGPLDVAMAGYFLAAANNSFDQTVQVVKLGGVNGIRVNNDDSEMARVHEAMIAGYIDHQGLTVGQMNDGFVVINNVPMEIPMHLIDPSTTLMYEKAEMAKFVEDMENRAVIDTITSRWRQGESGNILTKDEERAIVTNQANRMLKFGSKAQREAIRKELSTYFQRN